MKEGLSKNLQWEVVPFVFWDESFQKDTEKSVSESTQRRVFSLGMIDPSKIRQLENQMVTRSEVLV